MIKKILAILVIVIGAAGGAAAGYFLHPPSDEAASEVAHEAEEHQEDELNLLEYVALSNQFIIPVLGPDRIESVVILSLSLEIEPGFSEAIYAKEPRLRDAILQVLFDYSNAGSFQGSFTDSTKLAGLRSDLTDLVQGLIGGSVTNVLITDIVRQE